MTRSARMYCRSNVSFDNFLSSVFRGIAEFKRVPKQNEQGKGYTGLEIKMIKPDGEATTEVVGEDEE